MRAWFLVIALVGCTPDIFSGTYLCGPNQACPPGQACNGPDGVCELAGTEAPFACAPSSQREPDDTAAQGFALPALACVSAPYIGNGCLAAGDPADWFTFRVPSVCTAVEVQARMTYPISWETVALELWDLGSMTMIATDTACKVIPPGGELSGCITFPVANDGSYGIVIKPKGGGDCAGQCNFNRYQLTVQLSTPG
jgi:hypothetical protein